MPYVFKTVKTKEIKTPIFYFFDYLNQTALNY